MNKPDWKMTALAFGSNIGDKVDNIGRAVQLLDGHADIKLIESSSLYKTPPWGFIDQDWFVNACALFETRLDPQNLLTVCKGIEHELGREKSVRWGPRRIDVDILTYGEQTYSSDSLTIPHPRILERGFVLVPLNEIAPDLDIGGVSVREAMDRIDTQDIESLLPRVRR